MSCVRDAVGNVMVETSGFRLEERCVSFSTVQEVVFLAGCHHIVLVCLTSRGPGRLDVSIDCVGPSIRAALDCSVRWSYRIWKVELLQRSLFLCLFLSYICLYFVFKKTL